MAAAQRTTDAGDFAIGPAHTAIVPIAKKLEVVQGPVFGIPSKLEQYVLLAKSARGAGVANLIGRATGAPGVYVFSELLDVPTIKDLAKNELYSKDYELLEIFAFGTWADYAAKRDSLPKLNPAQESKLRHLTILSLAMNDRIIPYSLLLSSLDLPSVPVLEDLLIEAFYSGIMSGRLDQRLARLEVTTTTGRDVRPVELPKIKEIESSSTSRGDNMEVDGGAIASTSTLINTSHSITSLTRNLQDFLSTISNLLNSLEQNLAILQSDAINDITIKTEHDNLISNLVQDLIKNKEKESNHSNNNGNNGGGAGGGWKDSMGSIGSAFSGIGRKITNSGNSSGIPLVLQPVPVGGSSNSSSAGGGEDMDVDTPSAPVPKGLKSPTIVSNSTGGAAASSKKKRRM